MKKTLCTALCALFLLAAAAPAALAEGAPADGYDGAAVLTLDGDTASLDGVPVPEDDPGAAVYTAHDIVYYESGRGFTYGEGSEADEHDPDQAASHTVVHITQPGAYILRGALDPGQIAVDLGEDAADDPAAVVTLILDGVDVTCTVAPAVIFYNVYECDRSGNQGDAPDLSGAGAQVVIADGSYNRVDGSYVARIYKSYTLSEDGKSVTDSKKLHKYDGAFYAKMSMRITGGPAGSGVLDISAANEGLDTEMHLTIDGGILRIASGNDGINCNEDGVSVITINGGETHITVTGQTGEGDGIDSNGWLVINGGTVTAQACSSSADAGLDAENGIYLNGGLVAATGSMLDPIASSDQCGAVFTFSQRQSGGTRYALTGADRTEYAAFTPENDFSILLLSCPALTEGESCSLYAGESSVSVQAEAGVWGMGGGIGADMPGGHGPAMGPGQAPGEALEPPDGAQPGEAPEPPDGAQPGEALEPPDGAQPGGRSPVEAGQDASDVFTLSFGINNFRIFA